MTKDDKTVQALTQRLGEMVKENVELAERVKQLTSDYNKVVKQLQTTPSLSDLTEALDKVKMSEIDRDFIKKKCEHRQRLYEALLNLHCYQSKELKVAKEEREVAEDKYNDLSTEHTVLLQKYDAANAELRKAKEKLNEYLDDIFTLQDRNAVAEKYIARFEHADIEHADFSTMAFDCPHGVEAKVCSAECFGCEHCLTHGDTGTRSILCAYNYDKKEEKEQYLDKLRGQMIRGLNS